MMMADAGVVLPEHVPSVSFVTPGLRGCTNMTVRAGADRQVGRPRIGQPECARRREGAGLPGRSVTRARKEGALISGKSVGNKKKRSNIKANLSLRTEKAVGSTLQRQHFSTTYRQLPAVQYANTTQRDVEGTWKSDPSPCAGLSMFGQRGEK